MRYVRRYVEHAAISAEKVAIWSPVLQRRLTTRASVRELLDRCDRLDTLREHGERLTRLYRLSDDARPQIDELLRGLVQSRLLVSERELLATAEHAGDGERDRGARISTIVIPTCNRPEALRRCVASFADNTRTHGRQVRFRVLDDSASPEARRANLAVLRQLAASAGRIDYAGIRQKLAFLRQFCRAAKVPAELLAFALLDPEGCGHKPGGNRNAALLDGVDECAISVDDDIVCRIRPSPGQTRGAQVTSLRDPTETWLVRAAQLEHAPDGDPVDFVGLHERALGKRVHAVLAHTAGNDVSYHVDRLLQLRMEQTSARVLVSWTGFYGDSGAGSAHYYLWNPGTHRDELPSSRAALRAIIDARQIIRATQRLTIGNSSYCQTIAYGFDHRDLLPPFFPVFRGQDIVFGELLRSCVANGAIAYLPWAVHHQPAEPRGNRRGADDGLALHQVVMACLASSPLPPQLHSPAARLIALGQRLHELAAMPHADFAAFLRETTWRHRASLLGQLESLRGRHANPALEARLCRHISRLAASLHRTRHPRLLVGLGRASAHDDIAFAQRLLSRFAELLRAWPDITIAMRRFRDRGAGIAVPLDRARA